MASNKQTYTIALTSDERELVDEFRNSQPIPPSKQATMRALVMAGLKAVQSAEAAQK